MKKKAAATETPSALSWPELRIESWADLQWRLIRWRSNALFADRDAVRGL